MAAALTEKPTLEEYRDDYREQHGFPENIGGASNAFELNLRSIKQNIELSGEFSQVVSAIRNLPDGYLKNQQNLLFYSADALPEVRLSTKPLASVFNKAYRSNVHHNSNFPNPPKWGFTTFDNIFETVDDLFRTRIVCRYLDGPRFCCERLEEVCKKLGLNSYFRERSSDRGYYAWHFYFSVKQEVAVSRTETEQKSIRIEIQFTTQLAEVIAVLTHGLYEAQRVSKARPEWEWKWDAKSQEFRSAYLGHGLHLLEGIIQTFRDEVLEIGEEKVDNREESGAEE